MILQLSRFDLPLPDVRDRRVICHFLAWDHHKVDVGQGERCEI